MSENLDQAVAEYFSKNPNGNHPYPADETVRFMKDQKAENDRIWSKLESLKDGKVSYKMFWIIISFLVSLHLLLWGIVYNKLDSVFEKTTETQQTVSQIQGKLEPYDIEYK